MNRIVLAFISLVIGIGLGVGAYVFWHRSTAAVQNPSTSVTTTSSISSPAISISASTSSSSMPSASTQKHEPEFTYDDGGANYAVTTKTINVLNDVLKGSNGLEGYACADTDVAKLDALFTQYTPLDTGTTYTFTNASSGGAYDLTVIPNKTNDTGSAAFTNALSGLTGCGAGFPFNPVAASSAWLAFSDDCPLGGAAPDDPAAQAQMEKDHASCLAIQQHVAATLTLKNS